MSQGLPTHHWGPDSLVSLVMYFFKGAECTNGLKPHQPAELNVPGYPCPSKKTLLVDELNYLVAVVDLGFFRLLYRWIRKLHILLGNENSIHAGYNNLAAFKCNFLGHGLNSFVSATAYKRYEDNHDNASTIATGSRITKAMR